MSYFHLLEYAQELSSKIKRCHVECVHQGPHTHTHTHTHRDTHTETHTHTHTHTQTQSVQARHSVVNAEVKILL